MNGLKRSSRSVLSRESVAVIGLSIPVRHIESRIKKLQRRVVDDLVNFCAIDPGIADTPPRQLLRELVSRFFRSEATCSPSPAILQTNGRREFIGAKGRTAQRDRSDKKESERRRLGDRGCKQFEFEGRRGGRVANK